MRCSMPRMRAASVSAVSSSATATAPCITIGPASVSGMTKCTVAPEILTPAASAWPCGSRPGNDGSSEGWMLSILPYQRRTNSAVNSRMKPPRQISSIFSSSSRRCSTASKPARSLPNGLLSMTVVAMPCAAAFSRPPASARLEMTVTISAGKSGAFAASISAAMFEPRPEIRMATRRFMASPREVQMTVIDHAMLALMVSLRRDHLAEQRHALAARGENLGDLIDGVRLDDGDHADAAVEGAQQFELGNAALLGQPFEHRQHRQPRQIDADAEMFWQHARNVVGEAAAGDVGEALDRSGLADRAQAGFHIEPRRRQQRRAERHDRCERRRRIERKSGHLDDLAHQRIAVGVHARRCQADHRITGRDIGARQQGAALGGADRETAEVVVAILVEARHLGGLAANQRAAGFAAAFGNAGDNRGRGLRVKL